MFAHTPSHNTSTPRQSRTSRSTSSGFGQTPSRRTAGLGSARVSPYARKPPVGSPIPMHMKPPVGSPIPKHMKLFTPQEHMANKAAASNRKPNSNSTASFPTPMSLPGTRRVVSATDTPTRGRPATPLFPTSEQLRELSSSRASVAMFNPPVGARRPRDPALPTVRLLAVLHKCWSDDTAKLSCRTVTNGLLNDRCEELDHPAMWNPLGRAIHNVWPNLKGWIMNYTPPDYDTHWFFGADRIDGDECIEDPDIATKHSSSERVGFFMSPNAYMAACTLILKIARRDSDVRCLLGAGINPFFIIYVCADCGVPLPPFFSLELFWKHLDAIISAQCWRGLGADRTAIQNNTRGELRMSSEVSLENEDPEGIVRVLLALSLRNELPEKVSGLAQVYQVYITITGDQWLAKCKLGRLWYNANDLADKDVAPFAMLDMLTRVLPQWSGGILQIITQDVQLLWGVYGRPPSGAWSVMWKICRSHHIRLRAKWATLKSYEIGLPADHAKREALVPARAEKVVNTVVAELSMMEGDKAAYRKMICHLDGV